MRRGKKRLWPELFVRWRADSLTIVTNCVTGWEPGCASEDFVNRSRGGLRSLGLFALAEYLRPIGTALLLR